CPVPGNQLTATMIVTDRNVRVITFLSHLLRLDCAADGPPSCCLGSRVTCSPSTLSQLHRLVEIPIMADDLPGEQNVLEARSGADVVYDLIVAGEPRFGIGNHSDVQQTTAQIPGYDITGHVILSLVRYGKGFVLAVEIGHQILDAAVVNIG